VSRLTHLDENGAARMVDVSDKDETARAATAQSIIVLSADAFAAVIEGKAPKGDVLACARIAGIMAAKRVPDLIPLCHPIVLTAAEVHFAPDATRHAIVITAMVTITGKTGVEMEALTAASVAALTIYDMVKALDKGAVIESTRLLTKSGGKSGAFHAPPRKSAASPVRKSAPLSASGTDNPRETATRGRSAKPKVLMGEVFAPKIAAPDAQREAFRAFMTRRRLRATVWAAEAGVPVGEILGYLTGQSRGFSAATTAKLAKVAKVSPDEMFQ
jgi:cyclic pyranopterin monophosphate synthase